MGRRATEVTVAIALAFTLAGISEGCRTATQVELDVTYDGACSDLQEVAFIVGTDPEVAEGRIASNVFTTTTSHCDPGSPSRVGSLVVTPNDATGRASIIVLASFGGQRVTDCKADKGYAGCIIARRAFAFVEHTALELEIPLEMSCKNVPCDAVSTCKHASCVTSEVACSGSGCGEPGALPDGGTELTDAPTNPDAYVQGLDAQPPSDGSMTDVSIADGPVDSPVEATAGRCYPFENVSCSTTGASGTTCPNATDVCCRTFPVWTDAMATAADYACHDSMSCYSSMSQGGGTIVRCRSSRNCPGSEVCCLNTMTGSGESMCMSSCQITMGNFDGAPSYSFPQACESSCECPGKKGCNTPQTPSGVTYLTCDP